jgi:hypothetical protein
MKLNIVPAGTGIQWVKLGIRTFLKQPLALTGLFFLYWAAAFLLLVLPLVGPILALATMPISTLGMMIASHEAVEGRFPMPRAVAAHFRAGRKRLLALGLLGLIFAGVMMGLMALVPMMVDVSQLRTAVTPETMTPEIAAQVLSAMSVAALMYLPISLLFWHAPALVFWHGVSPGKSLFFSVVACLRNGKALLLFGLGWTAVVFAALMVMAMLSLVTGQLVAAFAFQPLVLMISAMFSTSLYFTFRDSFVATSDHAPPPPGEST